MPTIEPLRDCPWGCGLSYPHDPSDARCPPQRGDGSWANGPDIALGTDRQLRDDLRMLRDQMTAGLDRHCQAFLRRRVNTVTAELDRRGRP